MCLHSVVYFIYPYMKMSWLGHPLLLCTLDWHIFLPWRHSSALDTLFCRWWLSFSFCTLYYPGGSLLDWNSLLTCAFYSALETLFSLIQSLLPFCPGNSLHLCPPSSALGSLFYLWHFLLAMILSRQWRDHWK